jgi:MFS family permease
MSHPVAPDLDAQSRRGWLTLGVLGIVLATYLSDFSHEACTAVLPLYLGSIGLGAAALGLIEGLADFLVSMSKLAGGVVGHHLRRKRAISAVGYLVTGLASAAIGLVTGVAAILSLRSLAWVARGFRGPLRDDLLAEAVPATHYGRAYGLERAGDMLGAVSGPLVATVLVSLGVPFGSVILWSVVPGILAAAAMFFLTRDPQPKLVRAEEAGAAAKTRPPFPRLYWLLLVGVLLFGLGDFSRTFLILLTAQALGVAGRSAEATLSVPVLLYAGHNLISAAAALGFGYWGDRVSKTRLLLVGYTIGVFTNLLLAFLSGSLSWLIVAMVLSAIYLAAEQTLEKAAVAGVLPRELRSLGFGILASANAVGDMVSSLYVGVLLAYDLPLAAFGSAAAVGMIGVAWLGMVTWRSQARVQES